MFQLSPALLDSENNNIIDTKLNKKPSCSSNRTLKNKKSVEFEDTNTTNQTNVKNDDTIKNKITSLGNLMSKIHESNEEDDSYNTNYQSNLIDESISSSLTVSLNNELAKIQKMRDSGNNIPHNTFLDNSINPNNPSNPSNPNNPSNLNNLESANSLGQFASSKNSLSNYNDSYNSINSNTRSGLTLDNDKLLSKLDYIIHLLEEQHNEKTNHITEELILYLFLGLFILFVLDSFARASKYHR
jgi:hypothetical protein